MNPAAEYQTRLRVHQARAAALRRADLRLGAAKLAAAFLLLGFAWLWLISRVLAGAWLWFPLVTLAALFVAHDRVLAARVRAERTAAFYERGLARLENRWSGAGPSGERFRDPAHPYSDDLDLFGHGSLFELLSSARTPMGEARLAQWMGSAATPEEIARRQRRVAAEQPRLDLREQIAALAGALTDHMDPARLAAWAQAAPAFGGGFARWLWLGLTTAAVAAALYGLAAGALQLFFGLVLVEAAVVFALRSRWMPVVAGLSASREALELFAGILDHIPAEDFPAQDRSLHAQAHAPAAAVRSLARLADWIEASDSLLGRILDVTVLYSLHLAYAADAWRRRYGARLPGWIDAVADFEALLSLAGYSFEHPADPFPEIAATSDPFFSGEALGHPLLAEAECVRNTVQLDRDTRLWLLSGSNMSGKSTLLRTVGINAVLAQMGAPVRARRLRLSRLAVGTRLRTADSLQQGHSGFYAEILRLRQIFELTGGPLPLLFLFDELLEGTNSHDRVLGAAGLLRALLAQPTLGIVTTHDLALAALAGEFGSVVRNLHFEDQIEAGEVRFDHRLRPGVVTKSNALALMRIIGLKV